MQDICRQIERIHSEWSKMNLTDKMGYIIRVQSELNSMANTLAQNRILRGSFTLEELTAVRQLQDIQNDLDAHKADVNREIHDEIGKELFKTIVNLGRYVWIISVHSFDSCSTKKYLGGSAPKPRGVLAW